MLEGLFTRFFALQTWLFETVVQPLLFALGAMHLVDEAFLGTEALLLGALEIALLYLLLRPLEALAPAESRRDLAAIRVDVIYTFLQRLGILPLLIFFVLLPLEGWLDGLLHEMGTVRPSLETLIPPLGAAPFLAFIAYLVVLDFVAYWLHRWQHRFEWWWALHALHHSQRQMTFWTDKRNHLLDEIIVAGTLAVTARLIGVPPGQFVLLVALAAFVENLSHANTRAWFGRFGERLIVSPRFHRWHHAIGEGHEGGGPHGTARGINFAVLLPWWDILFGTADFRAGTPPTGIRDQLDGIDYGSGWWAQQILGIKRLLNPRVADLALKR